jgi:hypothetical protein
VGRIRKGIEVTQFQVGPIEPIRSYDAPTVAASLLLEGELTRRGVMAALFAPERLTLKERDTVIERMKERMGRSPLTNAIVDVATNPFVWFAFLTTPVGASALARGARGITVPAKQFSAFVMRNSGILAGLKTVQQTFDGTAIPPLLMEIMKNNEALDRKVADRVLPHLERLLDQHGLRTIDPDLVSGDKKGLANRINTTIEAWLRGLDQEHIEFVPVGNVTRERGEVKRAAVQLATVTRRAFTTLNLERELRRLGAWDTAVAMRDAMNERWIDVFGKDGLAWGVFEVDTDKVLRVFRGVRAGQTKAGPPNLWEGSGAQVISKLMSPAVGEAIKNRALSEGDFLRMIRTVAEAPILNARRGRSFYMPRNYTGAWGGELDPAELFSIQDSRSFVATGRVVPRRRAVPLWDPDDVQNYADVFGETNMTESYRGFREAQRTRLENIVAHEGGRPQFVQKINGFKQLVRYFKDTAETHSLYVAPVGSAVEIARGDFNKFANPQIIRQVGETWEEFRRRGQWGGISNADILQEQYAGIAGHSRYASEQLREVVLPRILGKPNLRHETSLAMILHAKRGIRSFLDSGVGRAMRNSDSELVRRFADRMEMWADPTIPLGTGRTPSSKIARYLYVTHLGVNLGSVFLNLTQPWLLAASWVGSGPIARGYVKAFKEMLGYLDDRIRTHGFKPLGFDDRNRLIAKHFKWSNIEGEDLLGIQRDAFATLDNISFARTALGRAGQHENVLLDYPMKLFEKAEWINRSVVAHAVEDLHRGAGRNLARGSDDYFRMLTDTQRLVSETQFGGTLLNTPIMFMNNSFFDNPLMRQFLQFPLRSVTGVTVQAARLGGRSGYFRSTVHDFMRGMGISALIYEAGKNLVGADLSRGLFASATTDLLGGERFLEDGNEFIPVPPIVDIPVDMIRGIITDDWDLMSQAIPRTIPGGVALSRALNMQAKLPEWMGGLADRLQRTHVGWDMRQPDGTVPLFSGDGRLIDFRNPPELLLRALGVDMGRFGQPGELDNFLVRQRDEIVNTRRDVIQALLSNEVSRAQSLTRRFERRFGIPLTITKDQLRAAIALRTTPRPERLLDRIPPDVRPFYQEALARTPISAERSALTPEELRQGETARQRAQLRQFEVPRLDPETVAALKQLVDRQQGPQPGESFVPFGGF